MKSTFFLALSLILFIGCKKDKVDIPANDNGFSNTVYTLSFTLQGEEHHFQFGENGYGFQYQSSALVSGDYVLLSVGTSFVWNGDPQTTNEGHVAFFLPDCVATSSEWNDNPTGTFLSYMAKEFPYPAGDPNAGHCMLSYTDPDGTVWNSYSTSQAGTNSSWSEYLYVVDNSIPQQVVGGGTATINLYNLVDDETEQVEVHWNIRFQEPS